MFAQSLSLSLRFAHRRHVHVIIMFSVSRFVCLRVFSFVIFGQLHAIFMFAWSIFIQFLCFNVSCCICDGIHADVAETFYFVWPLLCLYVG